MVYAFKRNMSSRHESNQYNDKSRFRWYLSIIKEVNLKELEKNSD